jgi:sortase A
MSLKVGIAAMLLALAFVSVVALVASFSEPMEPAAAAKSAEKPAVAPLTRSDPGVEPWKEETVAPAEPDAEAPRMEEAESPPPPEPEPEPLLKQGPEPEPEPLPVAEVDWPSPTEEQVEAANRTRRYELPPGAILALTARSIGLRNAPVLRSDAPGALDKGIVHTTGTSMPWSGTSERNVYLAGHRLGWPGTGSHLIFYRLDELSNGDKIVLRDREGGRYSYVVVDSFVVSPNDSWVMGRVRGRDLLTLQTCTGPNFSERLIVRAERV